MKAIYFLSAVLFANFAYAQTEKVELPSKVQAQTVEVSEVPQASAVATDVVVVATPTPAPAPEVAPVPTPTAPAATVVVKVQEKAKEEPSDKQVYLGLLYSSATDVRFGKVNSTGSSTDDSKADLNVGGVGGFTIGIQKFRDDVGFSFGLSHEAQRKITSSNLKTGASSTTTVYAEDEKASFTLTTIDLNAVFKSRSLYFPMGINYSLIHFREAVVAATDVDMSGGLGAQIGFGVMVTPKFSFEFLAKAIAINMKEKDSSGNTLVEYTQGYLGGVNVVGKMYF